MTKTLPGSFSIRLHKNFKNNLKYKLCRVEHTHTHTHIHTLSFIYIDLYFYVWKTNSGENNYDSNIKFLKYQITYVYDTKTVDNSV